MIQKTGKVFPLSKEGSRAEYADAIADALESELGRSHNAAKTITHWTGASDRAAKYWLSGSSGPSGRHLLLLAHHSDAVMRTIIALSGRDLYALALELNAAKAALARANAIIDALQAAQSDVR